jgi:hypothetical protein
MSEKTKTMVDKVIDQIRKGKVSIGYGYDRFSNGLNGKAFIYYIDTLKELNMIRIDNRGMLIEKSRKVWK